MGKNLNLGYTNNYLINLDEAKDRLLSSRNALGHMAIPFTRYPGIKHEKGIIGCGLSHRAILEFAVEGTAIFEDDIKMVEAYKEFFLEIPEGTDAIYLGVSDHGYVHPYQFGIRNTVKVSQFNKDFKRIHNMCSLHAVLYLSLDYINACKKVIDHCLEKDLPFDLGVASLHEDFQILTPNTPWFYQEPQPEFTNIILESNAH